MKEKLMKVAVYYRNDDVRIKKTAIPKIGDGEILIKVKASGICGSDVMEWYRIKKAPIVLGHEVTGEIVEVGKKVEGYKVGERIFASHHVPCDECHYCLAGHHTACPTLHSTNFDPGGFAEFIRLPEINVKKGIIKLPENLSFEEGTFIEPLACVLRAQRLAKVNPDDIVLIIGSGISGLLQLKLARYKGAKKIIITDINPYRLDIAKKIGADLTTLASEYSPEKLKKSTNGSLATKIFICAGALSAFEQAFESIDNGGTIVFFATPPPEIKVPLPATELWRREITMLTSYGASPQDLKASLELIARNEIKVEDLITHRLSLDDAPLGFKLVAEGKDSLKVIIMPETSNS